ncbi:hypothetical protein [Actinokineospora sp.]|uniref:hypothetical protein n=1 Tax=Actinokineospora sp. TaxID=1872133 RepID=UPI0040384A71
MAKVVNDRRTGRRRPGVGRGVPHRLEPRPRGRRQRYVTGRAHQLYDQRLPAGTDRATGQPTGYALHAAEHRAPPVLCPPNRIWVAKIEIAVLAQGRHRTAESAVRAELNWLVAVT